MYYKIKNKLMVKWEIFNFKYIYPISCFIKPRNQFIRKSIPRQWRDKVELICDVNFAILVDLVENEHGGLKEVNEHKKLYLETDKEQPEFKNDNNWYEFYCGLEHYYLYIKETKPVLDKQLSNAYPEIPENKDVLEWINEPRSDKERYEEVHRLEKLIEDKDTECLNWIVKNRSFFWT